MEKTLEEKVTEIADSLRAKGYSIPRSISDIPDFPCRSFAELRGALERRDLHIQRFAYEMSGDVFHGFASKGDRVTMFHYKLSIPIILIGSVFFAFMYSWWWLLAVILVVIPFKRMKTLYNNVITKAAYSSELFFCYLYSNKQVSIVTPDFTKSYYWKSEQKPATV